MRGSGPRNKGARTERGIVKVLQANGIAAVRMPDHNGYYHGRPRPTRQYASTGT
jgi:Holliday junction resolvase